MYLQIIVTLRYSHSTSASLHSICLSFVFFVFFFQEDSFKSGTTQSHQSTEMTLERTASHVKVTRPPCLFQLPPWEYVNRSTTLINSMCGIDWTWFQLNSTCSAVQQQQFYSYWTIY